MITFCIVVFFPDKELNEVLHRMSDCKYFDKKDSEKPESSPEESKYNHFYWFFWRKSRLFNLCPLFHILKVLKRKSQRMKN